MPVSWFVLLVTAIAELVIYGVGRRRAGWLLVAIVLTAIAPLAHAGDFAPTRRDTTMQITIVTATRKDIIEQCHAIGAESNAQHPGCAVANIPEHSCTIYVARPTDADDEATEVIGHEALHCFYGKYHAKPE